MKGYKELMAEAVAVSTTVALVEMETQVGGRYDLCRFADEVELAHTGIIPGAVHMA